ncbi:MAG: phospho-sugar mutase [Oscillospiraceae bacterium]
MNDINALYKLWSEKAVNDKDLLPELLSVKGNNDEILDRFYKNLEFGTAGLRGVIGAGTNRMNIYTVNQATQGLSDYLNSAFENPSIAIAYDSRIKSEVFAHSAASVLAANNIKVYLYPELVPTPMLSYAVRTLKCSSGIIITASHNPAKYNGYKCYDPNGYQMTDVAANKTYEFIQNVDMFEGSKTIDFDKAISDGKIEYIARDVFEGFYSEVLKAQVNEGICEKSDLSIIYTPLNGAGNLPVREIFKRIGIKDVTVVKEQEMPDGNFPTCPFPNPEIKQAFECAIAMTNQKKADLLIATDPDCDRMGIAVLEDGDYKLMSGNEVGAMLTEYVLSSLKEQNKMPKNPIVVKTIVTSQLVAEIAKAYGAETVDLLTGFKYIGELITNLEKENETDRFVIGMEESYGYLRGVHARDKDAVVSSMLVSEMAAFYKAKGMSLYDFMQSIYKKYGMFQSTLLNFNFEGAAGMQKMSDMMDMLRENHPMEIAGEKVISIADYKLQKITNNETGSEKALKLPKSNVLSYKLPGGSGVIVRPSGTEPKIKIYITAVAENFEKSSEKTEKISKSIEKILGIS